LKERFFVTHRSFGADAGSQPGVESGLRAHSGRHDKRSNSGVSSIACSCTMPSHICDHAGCCSGATLRTGAGHCRSGGARRRDARSRARNVHTVHRIRTLSPANVVRLGRGGPSECELHPVWRAANLI
jgi:hypothetical protein